MGSGDHDGEAGGKPFSVSCSICLDMVTDNGDRAWAKLMCGHEFHLDCIGSAFNIKGAMQCPNCRKIEKGQWLYANESRPFPEFNIDDWAHDEDLYDLGYTEMSFGLHWCPFSGLTRLPTSFDERDFSSTAYHDLLGQHAIFAEQTAVSSASNPCPYIAYVGPIHPSTSNSSGGVSSDGSSFNNHWNNSNISQSAPSEIPPTSYNFPTMDVHYQRWDHHHSSSFPITSGADHPPSIPSTSQMVSRANSDISRPGSFGHPFTLGHGSVSRPGNSVTSAMIPPYPGSVARTRDRVQALQAYFQQPTNSAPMRTPVMSSTRRSNGHRGMAQVGSMTSSSDQTGGGFYYFQPGSSTARNFSEPENQSSNRFHAWEREHLASFPLNPIDRDPVWGPFHQVAGPTSYRQSHGPSQNW